MKKQKATPQKAEKSTAPKKKKSTTPKKKKATTPKKKAEKATTPKKKKATTPKKKKADTPKKATPKKKKATPKKKKATPKKKKATPKKKSQAENTIHTTDAITITFGDQAENHAGMQKIGQAKDDGFTIDELKRIEKLMSNKGLDCEFIDLNEALDDEDDVDEAEPAGVLIIRGLFDLPEFNGEGADDLFHELKQIKWDTFLVSTRTTEIQRKHARANLCFSNAYDIPGYTKEMYKEHKNSEFWQTENLEYLYDEQTDLREDTGNKKAKLSKAAIMSGKGTVVKLETISVIDKFKKFIENNFGEHAKNLVAEGNSYVDNTKCGIGMHGDSERKIVIAIRLGDSFPMHFQWYHSAKPIGERIILPELNHGDVYIMSEKAVGADWKARSKITLRHAAGCAKYTK